MFRRFYLVFIVMFSALLIACSQVAIEDYENAEPLITIEEFFDGDLVAYGIVRDRSGKVIRHFEAVLKGEFTSTGGTLDEVFWFNDGERETRLWRMEKVEPGLYVGTANDVNGESFIESRGNAVRLSYDLRIPYNDGEIVVNMDDWMYQVSPGVVVNEAVMYKWGFRVGTVTVLIMRADATDQVPALVERFDQ